MTPGLRVGSLFAGYGGLEMGVTRVLGGEPAWFAEIDPAPSKVLAHHWPAVPNLGDITTVDWDTVPPVDVLTGGFPCQDVSHAGKRLGLKPGTRTGLWSHMAYAIDKLRPSLVVAENVRGLLSAEAGGDLEPCPWCVGNGEGSPLRALGAVLGDLADLGYDAQWHGVRASDAGAPHGRFRVFVYAWPTTDTDRVGHERARGARGRGARGRRGGPTDSGVTAPDTSSERHGRPTMGDRTRSVGHLDGEAPTAGDQRERAREVPRDRSPEVAAAADVQGREGTEPARGRHLPARGATPDTTSDRRHEGRTQPTRLERGPHAALSGHAAPADTDRVGHQRPRDTRGRWGGPTDNGGAPAPDTSGERHGRGVHPGNMGSVDGDHASEAWEREREREVPRDRSAETAPDAASARCGGGEEARTGGGDACAGTRCGEPQRGHPTPVRWGEYEPAIRRWETVTGRLAPAPTELGAKSATRLSPAFVEWMMGLPAGHVTAVPGLTRNDQLKALGNGVVPQQAALATRLWAATRTPTERTA
jgi:DNA (cytosine-5)-methyltransferase 1